MSWDLDNTSEATLFKVKYGKLQEKQFNEANVLFARIRMKKNFTGKQFEQPVEQSIGGGVGSGSLPVASQSLQKTMTLTRKKIYAVVSIDRESKKASATSEGAFVKFTKYPVKRTVDSFNHNLERAMTRGAIDGAGELIVGAAGNSNCSGVGSAGDPYVIELDAAGYYPAHFEQIEEGHLLNVKSETTNLEVVAVSVTVSNGAATGSISLVGSSARLDVIGDTGTPAPFIATDILYMQGSKDNEIVGLQGVLSATSGSIYGITVGRRWQAYQKDASSAALSTDLMNNVVMNVKRQCGKAPNLILSSYHQIEKLLNILEDHKRYNLPARDAKFKGQISFSAIEFISPDGVIPVVASKFIDSDKMYFLNTDKISLMLAIGGFEWFSDDGVVLLREATDSYEGRYGSYGQLDANPHFQGYLHSLAL